MSGGHQRCEIRGTGTVHAQCTVFITTHARNGSSVFFHLRNDSFNIGTQNLNMYYPLFSMTFYRIESDLRITAWIGLNLRIVILDLPIRFRESAGFVSNYPGLHKEENVHDFTIIIPKTLMEV